MQYQKAVLHRGAVKLPTAWNWGNCLEFFRPPTAMHCNGSPILPPCSLNWECLQRITLYHINWIATQSWATSLTELRYRCQKVWGRNLKPWEWKYENLKLCRGRVITWVMSVQCRTHEDWWHSHPSAQHWPVTCSTHPQCHNHRNHHQIYIIVIVINHH